MWYKTKYFIEANRAFLPQRCFSWQSGRGRERWHLVKSANGSSTNQWHLCRFTSTSCVQNYLLSPNNLSWWRHLTWPLFWTIHFSIAPQNHSSSFFSLCTFSGTLVVFQCTFQKQAPWKRCRNSWWSPSFVAALSSVATSVLVDAVPASNF